MSGSGYVRSGYSTLGVDMSSERVLIPRVGLFRGWGVGCRYSLLPRGGYLQEWVLTPKGGYFQGTHQRWVCPGSRNTFREAFLEE